MRYLLVILFIVSCNSINNSTVPSQPIILDDSEKISPCGVVNRSIIHLTVQDTSINRFVGGAKVNIVSISHQGYVVYTDTLGHAIVSYPGDDSVDIFFIVVECGSKTGYKDFFSILPHSVQCFNILIN